LLDRRREAEEAQHPAAVLSAWLVAAPREPTQPTLHGLRIERDLDRLARTMNELIGERQPAAAVGDPAFDVLVPRESRRRQIRRRRVRHRGNHRTSDLIVRRPSRIFDA
jgi:hypothetical protein